MERLVRPAVRRALLHRLRALPAVRARRRRRRAEDARVGRARSPASRADTIRALARRLAATRTLITLAWSLQRADHGEQPYWAAIALAAMLGQIGLPGGGFAFGHGSMNGVGVPRADVPAPEFGAGREAARCASIPVARIADMLEQPLGEYEFNGVRDYYPDIRLVYWAGGNPFHHHQDLNRLRRAWARPETVVVHEIVVDGHRAACRHRAAGHDDAGAQRRRRQLARPLRVRDAPGDQAGRVEPQRLRHLPRARRARRPRGGLHRGPQRDAVAAAHLRRRAPRRARARHPSAGVRGVLARRLVRDPGAATAVRAVREVPRGSRCASRCARRRAASRLFSDDSRRASATPTVRVTRRGCRPPSGSAHRRRSASRCIWSRPSRPTACTRRWIPGPVARASKVAGREAIRLHPGGRGRARASRAGDVVRVFNDRGACLAGAVLDDGSIEGVVAMQTGAWYDPDDDGLDRHGNVNVLSPRRGYIAPDAGVRCAVRAGAGRAPRRRRRPKSKCIARPHSCDRNAARVRILLKASVRRQGDPMSTSALRTPAPARPDRAALARRFAEVRAASVAICAPLDARGPRRAEHARREPREVAPRPSDLVLRALRARAACEPELRAASPALRLPVQLVLRERRAASIRAATAACCRGRPSPRCTRTARASTSAWRRCSRPLDERRLADVAPRIELGLTTRSSTRS